MLRNTPVQRGSVPRCACIDASACAAQSRAQPARLPGARRRARAGPEVRGNRAQGPRGGVRSFFVSATTTLFFTYSR